MLVMSFPFFSTGQMKKTQKNTVKVVFLVHNFYFLKQEGQSFYQCKFQGTIFIFSHMCLQFLKGSCATILHEGTTLGATKIKSSGKWVQQLHALYYIVVMLQNMLFLCKNNCITVIYFLESLYLT